MASLEKQRSERFMTEYEERLLATLEYQGELLSLIAREGRKTTETVVSTLKNNFKARLKELYERYHTRI